MAGMEPDELEETELKGRGKVRAGHAGDSLVLRIDALTTQTRRFKPLVREFFRKEFRAARPVFGDTWVRPSFAPLSAHSSRSSPKPSAESRPSSQRT